MPAHVREAPKCIMDIHSNTQGLGRVENEVEIASGRDICMRERRDRRRKAKEKAAIKQGKGSAESSSEARGGRRSW